MFGHDHIAGHHKAVPPPHLLQNLKQQIAMLRTGEQWSSLVTTGGNEVQIPRAVVAMKFVGHKGELAQKVKACM